MIPSLSNEISFPSLFPLPCCCCVKAERSRADRRFVVISRRRCTAGRFCRQRGGGDRRDPREVRQPAHDGAGHGRACEGKDQSVIYRLKSANFDLLTSFKATIKCFNLFLYPRMMIGIMFMSSTYPLIYSSILHRCSSP